MNQQEASLVCCFNCGESSSESGKKFIVTNCQHVFCAQCYSQKNFCRLCNKQCKVYEINDNLPNDIKAYFNPNSAAIMIQNVIKILQFQRKIRNFYIQKQYENRQKYNVGKKRILEMIESKEQISHEMQREKQYVEYIKRAYHTKVITPDIYHLGKTSTPKNSKSVLSSATNSSAKKNSTNYSPLARYSMTRSALSDATHSVESEKMDFSVNSSLREQENRRGELSQMQVTHHHRPKPRRLSHELYENARNVLLANTMRCMNDVTQTRSQGKRSQDKDHLSTLMSKKMRF